MGHYFRPKMSSDPQVFSNINLVPTFEKLMQFSFSLFVKFIVADQGFSSRLTLELCSLHQQIKPFSLRVSILMENNWSVSRNLLKMAKYALIFKNSKSNWD